MREKMRTKDTGFRAIEGLVPGVHAAARRLADRERLPPRPDFVDGLVTLSKALQVERELRFQQDHTSVAKNPTIDGRDADNASPRGRRFEHRPAAPDGADRK